MISCKLRLSSTFRASALWTNFARCGNPSTDKVEWKAYSVDDQNVLVIAGLGYYQFMDKFFTPGYLLDIVAARQQNA